MQIFADTLQIPIDVVAEKEIGCLGACIAAGIAVGIYNDYQDAISRTVEITRRIYPRTEYKDIYKKKYEAYRTVVQGMNNIWEQLNSVNYI